MIVGEIRGQQTSEMPLAEDDHVVQTLAPDGSDHSFRIRILPGERRSSRDVRSGDVSRRCGVGDDRATGWRLGSSVDEISLSGEK